MKNNTPKPLEVSPRDYHKKLKLNRANVFAPDSWMSKSKLWELHDSDLSRWIDGKDSFKGSKEADWGTLIDCLITTPDEFEEIAVHCPYRDFRSKEAQEFRERMKAAGKIILDESGSRNLGMPKECDVFKAADVLRNHPIAGPIIEASKKQVILTAQIQGVNFKSLLDLVPPEPFLADIKTTGVLKRREMEKKIATLGYHVQGAIYLKLWNLNFKNDQRKNFRLIWQEQTPPYDVVVSELSGMDLSLGEDWAAYALETIIEATENNEWPNFANGEVVMIERPAWAQMQDDESMNRPNEAPNLSEKEAA